MWLCLCLWALWAASFTNYSCCGAVSVWEVSGDQDCAYQKQTCLLSPFLKLFFFCVKNVFQLRSDEGGSISFTKQVNLLFLLYSWFSFVTAQTSNSSSRQSILHVQSFQGKRKNRVKCACHMYLNLKQGLFFYYNVVNLTVILQDRSRPTIIIIIKYWAQEWFLLQTHITVSVWIQGDHYSSDHVTKNAGKSFGFVASRFIFLSFSCVLSYFTRSISFLFLPLGVTLSFHRFLLNPPFALYLSFYAPLFLCQFILLPSVPYC